MRDLLVAVPTRGRPDSIARLRDAMEATCRGDTHLLAGVDDDDPCLTAYLGMPGVTFQALSGVRGVVACMNQMVMPRLGEYRAVGVLGDDFVPRTEGWDIAIMDALERTPFAYGNELFPGRAPGESCCHIFTRTEVVRALGYLGPPCFGHMFVDNCWAAWGKACGITYLDGAVIENAHPVAGKAAMDGTYEQANTYLGPDREAWGAYQAAGLTADIEKIRPVL